MLRTGCVYILASSSLDETDLPSHVYIQHAPHIYTSPTSPDAARCWIPCVDNLWERCTWELDFIVPRRWVEDSSSLVMTSKRRKGKGRARVQAVEGGFPITVAASGELIEHVRPDSALCRLVTRALTDTRAGSSL